jgi:phosphoglycolate phosphatase-like HAD superfamily hydrolase
VLDVKKYTLLDAMDELHTLLQLIRLKKKSDLIFDFDETLFYLELPWNRYVDGLCQIPEVQTSPLVGLYREKQLSLSVLQNRLVEQFGEPMLKKIRAYNVAFETENLGSVEAYDELLDVVLSFTRKRLYVWTSNTSVMVTSILQSHGMSSIFRNMATRLNLTYIKPHPEGFTFLRDPKTPKESYLLIGNSWLDREAAIAAGIDFYQINYFNERNRK